MEKKEKRSNQTKDPILQVIAVTSPPARCWKVMTGNDSHQARAALFIYLIVIHFYPHRVTVTHSG